MKKRTKKIISLLLCIVISGCFSLQVIAATNPYGKYQTIGGVTTVRCTWYAWEQAYSNTGAIMPNFGNAKNWYTSAQNNGFKVGSTPKAKSIAVWTDSGYGHVGYVVSVNGSKITVNEGGMLDTNGNAYNGTGILNGSVCNSAVGSKKSNYSSKILVGYIYLTENNSVGDTVTLKATADKNTISSNNAVLWGRVDKPSNYAVTKIGIKVRENNSTYNKGWEKYEAPSKSYEGYTYMYPYYDLNSELGAKLKHATKYFYRFYAVVNGKEYWSDEYSFTTTGQHSYSNSCDTTCNECGVTRKVGAHKYSNACDPTCNICGAQRTIKHTYSNDCDTTCNICSAKRTVTHAYKTVTVKATLTKNGSTTKKCSVCGEVARTSTIYYPKTVSIAATTYTYTGKVITPAITVKDSNGKTLKNGTDYTVSYASGRKDVGKYKVTVTFKGNYSGTKTFYFTINPVKTTVSKLTAGKKSIKVNISKKSTQVTGYEIQYSTNKNFKSAKTKNVSSYKTTSVNLTKLSSKKTYYVRVRTYKTVGKTKYYSGWSTYKYTKTK